ncbi:MAG: alpha/beta fold hydrolase [Thermoleophilia bacterium]
MATFVLVHGAWHGGWCWRRVLPLLRAAGHEAHAPTLTGLGDRAHLLTRDVGVETWVDDLCATLVAEDVRDAVLVGHSFAGLLVLAVAERLPGRIAQLVFLDAHTPEDGESPVDEAPALGPLVRAAAAEHGDGWLVPPWQAAALGIDDPADAAWVDARLTPFPLAAFEHRVALSSEIARAIPRTYVWCTRSLFGPIAEQARADGWPVLELDAGHDAMVTAPDALAGLLRRLVE